MANYEKEIDALVRDFVDELSELLRAAVTDSILEAVTGSTPKRLTRRKKPGPKKGSKRKKTTTTRKKKTTTRKKKSAGRKKTTTRKKSSGKRKRRSPEEIAKLEERILTKLSRKAYRPEALANELKMPVKELHVPLGKLVRSRKVKAKGNTRAKTYSAA